MKFMEFTRRVHRVKETRLRDGATERARTSYFVAPGVQLDSDQFVAPGVDRLFQLAMQGFEIAGSGRLVFFPTKNTRNQV